MDFKKWEEVCRPSEAHEFYRSMIGRWTVAMRVFTEGPKNPPTETKGLAECAWLDEGRWLRIETTGTLMGKPLYTVSIHGFDNYKKKHVAVSVDSQSTMMLYREGMLDRSGKNLVLFGPMDEPLTGEHDKPVQYVTRLLDADHMAFEIHDLSIGEADTKVIEILFTRAR